MKEQLNSTLQENLITLLAFDDVNGKVVASLAQPELFEGEYRVIAERCINYWHKHNEAPKNHTDDLVSDELEDPQNRKARIYRRILSSMYYLSESMNSTYVIDQLRTFSRMQRLKDGILKSAERLNQNQEMAIEEVEVIWNDLLRTREIDFDPGLRLLDIDRVVSYMQAQYNEFQTGVEALDKRFIVPARREVGLFLGETGAGKSWWLINLGKRALMQRKNVLHISLEMPEEQVAQRYYQALFSVSKRDVNVDVTTIEKDTFKRATGLGSDTIHPDFTFKSDYLRDELEARMNFAGTRMQRLIIKSFPTGSLTPNMLRGYLDNIELVEKFIPDLVLLDYVGIMKTVGKELRLSLGNNFRDIRGIAGERNVAFETTQQVSKEGARALNVSMTNVAEDWSLTNTADRVTVYSQTEGEKRLGLARLFAAKARNEEDKFGMLISQNYQTGQFILDCAMLHDGYYDIIKDYDDAQDEGDDGPYYDDDDEE